MDHEITVEPNRKKVKIDNAGDHTLIAVHKGVYYPHGFEVLTLILGVFLCARVIVTVLDGGAVPPVGGECKIQFQFSHTCAKGVTTDGELRRSPTGALNSIAKRINLTALAAAKNLGPYRKGTNGRLHFGISYSGPQQFIREYFGLLELGGAAAADKVARLAVYAPLQVAVAGVAPDFADVEEPAAPEPAAAPQFAPGLEFMKDIVDLDGNGYELWD